MIMERSDEAFEENGLVLRQVIFVNDLDDERPFETQAQAYAMLLKGVIRFIEKNEVVSLTGISLENGAVAGQEYIRLTVLESDK